MKVVIDGMDGSGKSTVASILSTETGYEHFTQKLVDKLGMNNDLYRKIVKYVRGSDNRFLSAMFYGFKCMLDLDDKSDSIIERGILSVYYFEHEHASENVFNNLIDECNVIPDLTFLLYASPEKRMNRIRERNPNDPDLKDSEAITDGYQIMLDFAKKHNVPYVGINTENRSSKEVAVICKGIMEGYEKIRPEKRKEYLERMNDIYGFEDIYEIGGKKLCKKNTT